MDTRFVPIFTTTGHFSIFPSYRTALIAHMALSSELRHLLNASGTDILDDRALGKLENRTFLEGQFYAILSISMMGNNSVAGNEEGAQIVRTFISAENKGSKAWRALCVRFDDKNDKPTLVGLEDQLRNLPNTNMDIRAVPAKISSIVARIAQIDADSVPSETAKIGILAKCLRKCTDID